MKTNWRPSEVQRRVRTSVTRRTSFTLRTKRWLKAYSCRPWVKGCRAYIFIAVGYHLDQPSPSQAMFSIPFHDLRHP